jgi:protein-L-isoaspartate(D-aspartate) O-methyltransferase
MTDQNFDAMRQAMVMSQLRTNEVNDPRVVAAMGAVARERFVPADRAPVAYIDRAVPLTENRALNLPMATGRLLVAVEAAASDRALVIGAASGYTAAVLSRLVASVVALEEDDALVAQAQAALAGFANVTLVQGPLVAGHADGAPYDVIVIDGAVERIPAEIVAQLAEGGRLAAAVIEDGVSRLTIGRRAGGGFGSRAFADAEAVPLPGFALPPSFVF